MIQPIKQLACLIGFLCLLAFPSLSDAGCVVESPTTYSAGANLRDDKCDTSGSKKIVLEGYSIVAVTGVSATTPSAATWTDMSPLTVTVGSSCNNLIVFIWTEGTAAQNVTLDIGKVRLVPGGYKGDILIPTFADVLAVSMRFYQKSFNYTTAPAQNAGTPTGEYVFLSAATGATSTQTPYIQLHPFMRSTPSSLTTYNPSAANAQIRNATDSADFTGTTTGTLSESGFTILGTGNAGLAVNEILKVHWAVDAEL